MKRPPVWAAFCTVLGVVPAPLLSGLLARWVEGAGVVDLGDLVVAEAEHLAQDLVGVFAEQRRAGDLARRVRQLDRVADRDVLATGGVVDLDYRAGGPQRLVFRDFLHRQDRAAGDVVLVEDFHRLELGLGHRPLFDAGEDLVQMRQARRRLGVFRIGLPGRLADDVADLLPDRRLGDEVDVGVGIGLPALALEDAAGLATAGIVAGARHRVAERHAFAELAVLLERAVAEALLVAHLDAAEIEHAVLHRGRDALALAARGALVERGKDADSKMQPGAGVADLRAGDERQAVAEAGGGGGAAGALGDVFINLAVLVRARAKALDRGHDHLRIEGVDFLPGKTHAVEHAGAEILDENIAALDQRGEDFLALGVLRVERD